ncbi:MAG: thioredoxin family protein [Planctomycetaceae bacterium]
MQNFVGVCALLAMFGGEPAQTEDAAECKSPPPCSISFPFSTPDLDLAEALFGGAQPQCNAPGGLHFTFGDDQQHPGRFFLTWFTSSDGCEKTANCCEAESGTGLLAFTADWCAPCRQMKPVINHLKQQGHAVEEIDIDAHPLPAQTFGVTSVPTFVFVKDGKEVGRYVGATSKECLVGLLKQGEGECQKAEACQQQVAAGSACQSKACATVQTGDTSCQCRNCPAACCPCPPAMAYGPMYSHPPYIGHPGPVHRYHVLHGEGYHDPYAVYPPAPPIAPVFVPLPPHAPGIPGAVQTEMLIRATYEVPAHKAKALAAFLSEHAGATAEVKIGPPRVVTWTTDGPYGRLVRKTETVAKETTDAASTRVTITTTPDAQHAIGVFIMTFLQKPEPPKPHCQPGSWTTKDETSKVFQYHFGITR